MSDGSPGRRRAVPTLALGLGALLAAAWVVRRPLLTAVGSFLVAEDPLAPAEVLIVSNTNVRAVALEAADLYRAGVSASILLPEQRADRLDALLERRGVRLASTTALARAILEASGVPPTAIALLPGPVDGTSAEIRAIVAHAARERPRRILYLTARSHTARARRKLRRELPPGTDAAVRASRYDPFAAESWWQRRGTTREVLTEYLRWVNTFALGDLWRRRSGDVL